MNFVETYNETFIENETYKDASTCTLMRMSSLLFLLASFEKDPILSSQETFFTFQVNLHPFLAFDCPPSGILFPMK